MTDIRRPRPVIGLLFTALSLAILAGCAGGGAASTSPPGAAPSTVASVVLPAGFPVGTWTTTITADDLMAITDETLASVGMTRDNLIKENSGTFTTVYGADGTWSTVQDTDQPVKWPIFRGTFTPVGDDAFDQATTFPPDFAGDVVRFTWRSEGGRLHLKVVDPPDPVLPVITEAHPWTPAG